MDVVHDVNEMSVLLEVLGHLKLHEKEPDLARRDLHAPSGDSDNACDNEDVMPNPDQQEHLVVDHVEAEDAHAVPTVQASPEAEAGVVAADLLGKELTHGIIGGGELALLRGQTVVSGDEA